MFTSYLGSSFSCIHNGTEAPLSLSCRFNLFLKRPCTSNFVLSQSCTCSGLVCTSRLILLLFLTLNHALTLPCTSDFVLSLSCTCKGTAMHLSPNHCLPCTCSGIAVHLSPNLVTILNLKPCSDTELHL